uniref:tRNA (guanine-N(7)-)-methyltransferase n=1 Tax=Neobodo designis TaxID=312471 RepID=A0A7S1MG24_NEODS
MAAPVDLRPTPTPGLIPPLDVTASGEAPKWTRLPIRTRPHRNPLAENDDEHPFSPEEVARELMPTYYPAVTATGAPSPSAGKDIEIADIGCAFGGMLISLAPHFPTTRMIGLEIRSRVVSFAQGKTQALREAAKDAPPPPEGSTYHDYTNLWFEQCNVMRYGTRFFRKGQLTRLFFAHPDPHWKVKNIRRRIISPGLVHVYAYWMRLGGLVYTVSDVPELEQWMIDCLDASPMFQRLTDEELEQDRTVLDIAVTTSEDAQRAQRKGLPKNFAVHRRINPADKKPVAPATA